MAIGLVMTFDGVTKEQYEAVMAHSAIDLRSPGNPSGAAEWPAGGMSHYAGPTPTGWCVVDIWESQEQFDAFLGARLGPVLEDVGVPQPNVTSFDVYNAVQAVPV
jgi:hypothetical protein